MAGRDDRDCPDHGCWGATSALTLISAPGVATLFSCSAESAHLAPVITAFHQVMCLFHIFMPPGLMSSSLVLVSGIGMTALTLTVLRELVCTGFFVYLLAIPFGLGEMGVWWGSSSAYRGEHHRVCLGAALHQAYGRCPGRTVCGRCLNDQLFFYTRVGSWPQDFEGSYRYRRV